MRISEPSYLQGLTPAERRQIVLQAVAEQQAEVDKLVGALFAGVRQETVEASRPLSYWSSLARDNARNPPTRPVDFWSYQEALRKQRAEASSLFPQGPLGNQNTPALRPGVGAGLSPVEFATGVRQTSTVQPKIGLPTPSPVQTLRYEDIVTIKSEVTSPVGRLVDVYA
jgi:hypothetical protein